MSYLRKRKYISISIILVVLVVLVAALVVFWMSNRNLTSHHASINVHLSEDDSFVGRLSKYEKVVEVMKSWAVESNMYLVEGGEVNLSTFTTNPDADVRGCCFKDKLSSDGPMPLQVMSSYDANGFLQIVRIMFAEGYSREPSERMERLSSDLHARLVKVNEATYYSIW
ncbi:MAG: hypothetical protein J7K65_10220 [Planctomycetes bacterium]|nr:hypothetical protein [Planctomycetota bacterium]